MKLLKLIVKRMHEFSINGEGIKNINNQTGNRFFGICFTFNNNRLIHVQKIMEIVEGFCKYVRWKKLTEKIIVMIWNVVIIPAIEFQLQAVVLTEAECDKIMVKVNNVVKHSCFLPTSCPNAVMYDKELFNFKNIYYLQLESLSKTILYYSNGNSELKKLFKLNLRKLQ